MKERTNITELLAELSTHGNEEASSPILHLHLYCHHLSGSLISNSELEIRLNQGGYSLRTLHIFTAEVQHFSRLIFIGSRVKEPTQICLYYDAESGPASFWVNHSESHSAAVHILRSQDACLDRSKAPWIETLHFDLALADVAGIRLQVSGQTGVASSIQPIPSVYWDELRFIKRCARTAPNFSSLVSESDTVPSRLELLKGFPKPAETSSNDWFFVPPQVPQTLATAMDGRITTLIEANRYIENQTEMQKLRGLTMEKSSAMMKTVEISVGTAVEIDAAEATSRTVAAGEKMDDLWIFQRDGSG